MAVLFGIGSTTDLQNLRRLGFQVETSTEQEVRKAFGSKVNLPLNTVFMKIFLDKWNIRDIIEALKHLTREFDTNECESIGSEGQPARGREAIKRLCGSGDADDLEHRPPLRIVY